MIPTQSLEIYPIFGSNATKIQPDSAKMSAGYQQADVLPAEWMNWKWNKDSRLITELQEGVSSMETEINTVLVSRNVTPDASETDQLLTALEKIKAEAKAEAILASHPVGSYYWTSTNENPATTFGGGTWVQVKDKFILAAGDTYSNGATGGAATVTLTSDQIPSHYHTGTTGNDYPDHNHSMPGALTNVYNGSEIVTVGGSSWMLRNADNTTGGVSTNHKHDFQTSAEGGGQAHNNMPPYEVAYCWKRTA